MLILTKKAKNQIMRKSISFCEQKINFAKKYHSKNRKRRKNAQCGNKAASKSIGNAEIGIPTYLPQSPLPAKPAPSDAGLPLRNKPYRAPGHRTKAAYSAHCL